MNANEEFPPESIIGKTFSDHPTITVEGLTGKWSGSREPKIGDRVKITFNGLGTGTITGVFLDSGFLGVRVAPDPGQRPEWHIKQFERNPGWVFNGYTVFGAEIKFL